MKITERDVKDVHILAPEGKVTLGDGDQELGEAVRQSLEKGHRKVLINFSVERMLAQMAAVADATAEQVRNVVVGGRLIQELYRPPCP